MKLALKVVGALVVVVLLAAAGFYVWAAIAVDRARSRTFDVHRVAFPVPFPLSDEETARRGVSGDEAAAVARQQAVERGQHLVESRYVCIECHGRNFGGGVVIDSAVIGRLFGPNLTEGTGSRTLNYQVADWDRMVRHGVRPDGTPGMMPSEDFQRMSDEELSDIISYIRSMPPVNNEVAPVSLGPLGTVLMATGQLRLSADVIASHQSPHERFPPDAEVSPAFGQHLAGVCVGCHREDLAGGPIAGGDPSWVPAANLTPHATGLGGWTYEQFVTALHEGRRPDGTALREPMTLVLPYAANMTDIELRALWAYLQSVPPVPSRE
jgi:mono/diheme cytochrome c family protein